MSFLIELRTLLIETRMALRGASAEFDEDPLRTRLDQALRDINEYVLPPPAANTKTTAQQVALAWQTVCRGLKLSHPELYDELARKVMNLLDERELVEPVTELLQLEAQVKQLDAKLKATQARQAERDRKHAEVQARLDALYAALAAARPEPASAPDAQAQALQRIEALVASGSVRSTAGKDGKRAAAPVENPVPDRAVLEAVAAQQRPFSKDQREWSVAECLALTAWQFTPVELIEKGDAWMAQKLLGAPDAAR